MAWGGGRGKMSDSDSRASMPGNALAAQEIFELSLSLPWIQVIVAVQEVAYLLSLGARIQHMVEEEKVW